MAHIHEKIDFTVTVYVVSGDAVLLRKHEKYHGWFGVGGHIELDEDANAAAIRETKEEVGLDVTLVPPKGWVSPTPGKTERYQELIPPLFLNIHQITDIHQHHDFVYAGISETRDVVPESPTDVWKWCTKEEIESDSALDHNVRHYALAALSVAGS